jgi:hypothetical protein
MAYQRKTKTLYVIQQYTGPQYGWEDVDQQETYKEAKRSLKEYRENQPEYPVRLKTRREKLTPA